MSDTLRRKITGSGGCTYERLSSGMRVYTADEKVLGVIIERPSSAPIARIGQGGTSGLIDPYVVYRDGECVGVSTLVEAVRLLRGDTR